MKQNRKPFFSQLCYSSVFFSSLNIFVKRNMTCHFLLVNLTYESRKFVCEKKIIKEMQREILICICMYIINLKRKENERNLSLST